MLAVYRSTPVTLHGATLLAFRETDPHTVLHVRFLSCHGRGAFRYHDCG